MRGCRFIVAIFAAALLVPVQSVATSGGRDAWRTTLTGVSTETIDDAVRAAVDPTGAVVVLGFRRSIDDTQTAFLARVAEDGTVLWESELPVAAPFMNPVGVVLTPSGEIVTLVATIGVAGANGVLSRHSANGTLVWSRAIAAPGTRTVAAGLALAPNGNLLVAATRALSTGIAPTRGVLQAYDGDGAPLWTTEIRIGERNQLLDVTVDRSGRAHVSGWTRPTLATSDLAEVLYAVVDRNGVVVRQMAVGVPGTNVIAWEISVSPSGEVFFAGTDRANTRVPAVRAYAARLGGAAFAWYAPLAAEDWSFNGGIALTPDGRLVQGASEVYDSGLHTVVRVLDASTGQQLSRHGHYHADSPEEDVHEVVVRSAHEITAVGGRTLVDGTWRAFVAREQLGRSQ